MNREQRRKREAELRRTQKAARRLAASFANVPLQAGVTESDAAMQGGSDFAELAFEALAAGENKLPTFTMSAYNGGPFRPGGWWNEDPIIVDLEGMNVPANVPIDSGHATDVGHTTKLDKSVKSLRASGVLSSYSPDDADEEAMEARKMVRKSKNGFPFQASIDFTAARNKIEFIRAGESVRVNGRTFDGPVYVARASNLRKIAILSSGADSTTETKIAAKPGDTSMNPEFVAWLKANDYPEAPVGEQLVRLQAKWEKSKLPPTPTPAPTPPAVVPLSGNDAVAEMRAAAAMESKRIGDITAICMKAGNPEIDVAGVKVNLQAHAVAEGWQADKVKLEAQTIELANLRASRVNGPHIFVSSGAPAPTNEILQASLCIKSKLPNLDKSFKPEILEQADKHFRDVGLQQMFLMAAAMNGYGVRPGDRINGNGKLREVLRYAFAPMQASSSTISLPNILGAVAYKVLVTGYMEEDQNWRNIARIMPVNNFYQRTCMRLLDNMVYEQLGPNGEIKHGSVSEETYTAQAKTYAKMFALTREAIINDDISAFDTLRMKLGRGAAQRFNVVFWTAFLSNASTFWTTTRTNYITGATTNLSTDGVGLGLAVKAIRKMTSPTADGTKHVGSFVNPTMIVVPPELEQVAQQIYLNENFGAGTTVANANIYRGKYKVIVPWQLSDSNYTGNSSTAWYLLGDPNISASVVVSFLNGQETPTVESADADFDTLGVQFRGYHDFGCDQADYLCGIKSKGAA